MGKVPEAIARHVSEVMKSDRYRFDPGTGDVTLSRISSHPDHPGLAEWVNEMTAWAHRVRRDILVLEGTINQMKGLNPGTGPFFGDPGDPPPPPPDF